MSQIKSGSDIVGGGAKKILYTLSTLKRIGLRNSAKALKANNTCKACGLGMGGQQGGMVNELGEFPSVCNKSIQAQSTDIQAPIPSELFDHHRIQDFQELSGKQIEHLGRLGNPIYKAKDSDKYSELSWDAAIDLIAARMQKVDPDKSFFYSSGRSSNEAGFVLQLLARIFGTNNINNCSYYCHQATGVGLSNAIGSGTATVELEDLSRSDLVFLVGANPASNHPRLIHKLKDLRDRGGKIIVINPAKEPGLVRFAVPKSPKSLILGGTEIASHYLQPKIGSDIALFSGIAKALIDTGNAHDNFISEHSRGFDDYKAAIQQRSWESIVAQCGIAQTEIEDIAAVYAQSQSTIFAWGMGLTHHLNGVDNIEQLANLALLRGMIGKPGAGLLPLRGHSNVQGIGTIGVKPVLAEDVFAKIEDTFQVRLPTTEGLDTIACLEKATRGDIDFALMMGGNLFSASPDTPWTRAAFEKIGFKVFLTTTLNHGHVNGTDGTESLVLPVTARDEEWEASTQESMFNYLRMSDGGIHRHQNTRPESHILSDIAVAAMPQCELDFSKFKQHRHTREAIANIIPGLEGLAEIDTTKQEFSIPGRILHTPSFNTHDGRAVFSTPTSASPQADKNFPFRLMTVRSEGQFNTIVYEEDDSYRGTTNRWSALMNPEDIAELKINPKVAGEDTITITSARGKMEKVKVYPFDIPRHNMMAYYPEANVLLGIEHDPRSKTPSFKNVGVKIEKD